MFGGFVADCLYLLNLAKTNMLSSSNKAQKIPRRKILRFSNIVEQKWQILAVLYTTLCGTYLIYALRHFVMHPFGTDLTDVDWYFSDVFFTGFSNNFKWILLIIAHWSSTVQHFWKYNFRSFVNIYFKYVTNRSIERYFLPIHVPKSNHTRYKNCFDKNLKPAPLDGTNTAI